MRSSRPTSSVCPDSCNVTLERGASTSASPPSESFKLAADSVGHVDETIAVHLSRLYPDHPVRNAAAGSIDPRDHERYVRLVHSYWSGSDAGSASTDDVLAEIERIRARSPRSIDVLLFEAEILRHRYVQTEAPEQADLALALLRDANELLPDTYGILSARFDLVLSTRRLDEADAFLDRLATLDPDSSVTHLQRAKLHLQRGELDQARGELDTAARRDSFSWRVLYYRAKVSRELGDRAATQAAINQLLALSPGNYAGLSLRARAELDTGQLACAEQLYARLVAREPLYYECLNLGDTRNQLGRYREAMDSFHCVLRIRPDDPAARLDLAEAHLLAGDVADASEELHALLDLLARKRRDAPGKALLDRDLLVEAQTLAYLGRDDRALAAAARARVAELVRPAVRPAAPTLYTAALVHAVLGDRDLAVRYVTQYLDAGNSPADLGYPWFDDLRRDPVLGPRLAVPPPARTCEASSAP